MKSIRLEDYLKRMSDIGVNLSGCIIQGPQYRYKFHELTDNGELRVFYGGSFENTGTLTRFMRVYSVAVTSVTSLYVPLKNGNITLRCRSTP